MGDSLAKILKMCGPTDSLKLRWQSGADTVGLQCESGGDDRIADFDLKLMQIESEHMEIPEQQYKVTARLPSTEFQRICRDLKEFGETMQVKASKEAQGGRKARGKGGLDGARARDSNLRSALPREFRKGRSAQWCRRVGSWTGRPVAREV